VTGPFIVDQAYRFNSYHTHFSPVVTKVVIFRGYGEGGIRTPWPVE
jgi:hypothetical protein